MRRTRSSPSCTRSSRDPSPPRPQPGAGRPRRDEARRSMDRPDEVLVAEARAGQAAAFDELARRHRPGLVRLAASLIGDADEAESLAQETLTRALTLLET